MTNDNSEGARFDQQRWVAAMAYYGLPTAEGEYQRFF